MECIKITNQPRFDVMIYNGENYLEMINFTKCTCLCESTIKVAANNVVDMRTKVNEDSVLEMKVLSYINKKGEIKYITQGDYVVMTGKNADIIKVLSPVEFTDKYKLL